MKKELLLIGTICAGLGFSGCSSAPGTAGQQGAVVGGATGAAVGASVTKNRALGAIIGGAAGAAGGYVIGNKTGHIDKKDNTSTTTSPDTAEHTATGETADLNHDGFVTLDEIVKLDKNGVSDDEMVRRIQATGLTFDLNEEQRKYLTDHGVSQTVIDRLPTINRSTTTTTTTTTSSDGTTVISK
jgi:hypothetical protein